MKRIAFVVFPERRASASRAGSPTDTVESFDHLLQKYSASSTATAPKFKDPCICREAGTRRVGVLMHIPPPGSAVLTPFFIICVVPSYDANGLEGGMSTFCSDFDVVSK